MAVLQGAVFAVFLLALGMISANIAYCHREVTTSRKQVVA